MERTGTGAAVRPRRLGLLEGKVALITGAGSGIGRAAALAFASEGARLVLADRDPTGLEETERLVVPEGDAVATITADIAKRRDVREVSNLIRSEFRSLDCAFNNAGVTGPLHPLVGYPDDQLDMVLEINVKGTWNCLQEEIPLMLENGGGSIVNASSGVGEVGSPFMSGYVASKHAVMGLTRAAALEHPTDGIRVNAVLPGIVDTSMPVKLTASAPEVMEGFRNASPMGRLANPEEVAEAALWLCSDRASFINGQGLAVDGGILAQ